MNRSQLDKYITDYYGVRAERLFEKNPGFQVYRHNAVSYTHLTLPTKA